MPTSCASGSISINNGAAWTTNTSVTLNLTASDPEPGSSQIEMRFKNAGGSWTAWEPFATTKSWTLASGDGAKTVYVQYRDPFGHVSAAIRDSIGLDQAQPNFSAFYAHTDWTQSTAITLTLTASDATSGLDVMRFANGGGNWSSWQTFHTPHPYTLPGGDGLKTVRAQVRDAAGNLSITRTTTIILDTTTQPIQGLNATNNSPTRLQQATRLTATITAGTNVTYTWAFGDGQTGNGAVVNHTYPAVGSYTAVVTASNTAGSVADSTAVVVEQPITGLSATNDSPTQVGQATRLTATVITGTNVSYAWAFGDGETGSGAVVTHTYPAVGNYTAIVTASNPVDMATDTTQVVIADRPVAGLNATNDSPTELGQPTTLAATVITGTNVSYAWALGDGQTGSGQVVTHTYPATGTYTAVVTASNSRGEDTASTLGFIQDEAITLLSATDDSPTDLGQVTTLTATVQAGTNVSYAWAFGDGQTGSGAVVTHTYPAAGIYTAVVTASNSVSLITDTTTVAILGIPALTIGKRGPATAVVGELITYTLTVTNQGSASAHDLVIADVLPAGANYVSGGTRDGGVVTWTLASLAPGMSDTVQFAVTATQTIRNADYWVTAEEGISATGQAVVTTTIRAWRLVTTTLSPPVAGEHGMAYDSQRDVVVLYGGNATGYPYENATWEFDGSDWEEITTTQRPAARYGVAMAYDSAGDVTVLFGGGDETDAARAETLEYDGTDWKQVFPATSPVSRTYASMAADPTSGTVYLLGGNDQETYYADLWAYADGEWQVITPTTQSPPARSLAAMAYDAGHDRLLLFGGRGVTATVLADLWAFDLATSTWIELTDPGDGPSARQAHSLTYDPSSRDIILVGGVAADGNTLLGDTWHYRDDWTEAAAPLPARAYHQVVYNSVTGNLILFSNREVWRYE